ncbi:MAG: CAP domain-containing protein [Phycisphaerales bacterium]|nr:MAG: CAP domain-containing protein [Phycisphaerales bacterium]
MLNLRRLIITGEFLLLSVVCTGCFSTAPADEQQADAMRVREPEPCITPEDAERMADQVLQLVNLERAERNLQPVVVSEKLTKIAEDYACRMIDAKFFGHRSPLTGHGPAKRAVAGKYTFYAVGENLAAGPESSAEVMKLWMDSPPHRDIILDPTWKEVGIAVRAGGEYSTYWVQEFGDPAGL